jgi:hypothetical protein
LRKPVFSFLINHTYYYRRFNAMIGKGLNRSRTAFVLALLAFWFVLSPTALGADSSPRWIQFTPGDEKIPQINLTQSDQNRVEFEVKVFGMWSEQLQTKGGVFNQLSIPECGITNVVGEPRLPVIRKMVQIPYGAEVDVDNPGPTPNPENRRCLGEYRVCDP